MGVGRLVGLAGAVGCAVPLGTLLGVGRGAELGAVVALGTGLVVVPDTGAGAWLGTALDPPGSGEPFAPVAEPGLLSAPGVGDRFGLGVG